MIQENIFSALSHYDESTAENYLTEAFAYLIRMLCQRNPAKTLDFINKLCGPLPYHPIESISAIKVGTQKDLGEYGQVDLVIEEHADTMVFIEIKHDSSLGPKQLERYYQALIEKPQKNVRLVLLKRHKNIGNGVSLSADQFHLVTWYEVHKWLKNIKGADDELMVFFLKDFQEFLEEKNMKLKRVTWEYIQGLPALLELRNLLEAAKNEIMPRAHLRRTQGWSWFGLYIDKNFFFGVRYDKPLVVVYENNFGNHPTSRIALDLEEEHFFSLKVDAQLSVLMKFLEKASKDVKRGKAESAPLEKEIES